MKKMEAVKSRKRDIIFPIGFKLVTIITILLLISLGVITALVSYFVSDDVRRTAEENNLSINQRSTTETELVLGMIRSNALALVDTLDALEKLPESIPPELLRSTEVFFFEQNKDVALVYHSGKSLVNETFFLSNDAESAAALSFIAEKEETARRAAAGELVILNASPAFGFPVLAMFCPRPEKENSAVIFFSPDSLGEIFGTGANASFIINDDGDVLIHADTGMTAAAVNMEGEPFIRDIWKSEGKMLQTIYTDADGKKYLGAYRKLSIANAALVTRIEFETIFEGVIATTWRNIFLTGAVLFSSILFIWFFSKTLSGPLKRLAAAAGRIKNGEYAIDLAAKSRDEIGYLTQSFVSMGRGLAERERLKDTFGRFINRDIAEKAMKGELTLGGETKTVTVFFSDIRDFTSISETMTAQDVVDFLNSYLSRMVECVNKTGGVVDKFIGDSVMAVWGAPVSAGSTARDALACVRSALMMRIALARYNNDKTNENRPKLKIGCGINTGDVVAGQIGSKERMEYTVIGDTVNLASRTESLNKPLGTDILITENTWELIRNYIITEEMPPVRVKGKVKPIRMFAVVNMKVEGGPQPKPETLAEVRSMLNISAPKLGSVDVNAKEKKYKIGN
ncbi:adenylate/guanylate cyclase domain-containing protein [Spirochaetia bacterium]|nr:adenylate/guanylate cyclase domain-containing protein [Spirochaetia bacterium]